jgi:hypothetical protein
MTDYQEPNPNPNPSENRPPSSSEAWQEVGRQFKLLGESISLAFQAAWQDEENRRRMEGMRSGLESMVSEVGNTIKEAANSPQSQRVREHGRQAAAEFRAASEQTVQDIRPHLVTALRQLNQELQKLTDRMETPAHTTESEVKTEDTNIPPE